MKTLYLDCAMGAAGDMLMAALLELIDEPEDFVRQMNALGIPGVQVRREASVKCGITGTHMNVTVNGEEEESHDAHAHDHEHDHEHHDHHHDHHDHEHSHDHEHEHGHHDHEHSHKHEHHHEHEHHDHGEHDHDHHHEHGHSHEHHHSGMQQIESLIRSLPVSQKAQDDALAVYGLIAEAESHAHGRPVEQIHFHEVGTMDAVADVVGVCLLMERLGVDRVVVSPVHVGSGQVRCAHGILPVPAPATAHILRGVPTYGGQIRGELCTPTGAALLKHFAGSFGSMPVMRVESIGYGMGKKDFEAANCVRAMLGSSGSEQDEVVEISCNLDDMTAEAIGYATEALLEAGALDVYAIPIQMKKNRPATMLCCLCRPADHERMAQLMLKNTTTLGVRSRLLERHILRPGKDCVSTPYGEIALKTAEGYGLKKCKPEFDSVARAAKEHGVPYETVARAAMLAANTQD